MSTPCPPENHEMALRILLQPCQLATGYIPKIEFTTFPCLRCRKVVTNDPHSPFRCSPDLLILDHVKPDPTAPIKMYVPWQARARLEAQEKVDD